IVDCGSTKTHWCLLNNNTVQNEYFTLGMNAVLLTAPEMEEIVRRELLPQMDTLAEAVEEVYFYGAGCLGDEICGNVAAALGAVFTKARGIEADTDLLGAARALCGREPGIACILGTGSNSCYYDGEKIADNVSPLGYILGDEGSGAVLGKILVGDVLKRQLPDDLCEKFLSQFGLDRLGIIRRVYKEPAANRFLASTSPFLLANIDRPEIHDLVVNAFKAFFRRNIANYACAGKYPVSFIGSIACYYEPQLREAAAPFGYTIGNIVKSPMPGLIAFHTR
ncbi:MAG: ATPase, partial [Muribaculaceae bacterium]|nr:ATPase [Muribaculaceae bacterium]